MDIMLDLETLGTGPEAVIIAIGTVAFTPTGLGETYYDTIAPQSAVDLGMEIDASTVMWWMRQSDAARVAFARPGKPILEVLRSFSLWMDKFHGEADVWGNGAAFDNVVLSSAYRLAKQPRPWSYKADRCYRTLKELYPFVKPVDVGTAHNALDDAKAQALHCSTLLRTAGVWK